MKNITITGPRSVGKSTVSKLLAKELKKKYISSDEIGDKALKKFGGLDNAIKSGDIKKELEKRGYGLIKEVYNKEKDFVFDLAGGAFSSKTFSEISFSVRKLAKEKSFVIGLLPFRNSLKSILFLFRREKKREHFLKMNRLKLLRKTRKSYVRLLPLFKRDVDVLIYTRNMSPEKIVRELVEVLEK